MTRALLALLALVVFLSMACIPCRAPSRQDLARKLGGLNVALVNAEDEHVYCSGVWVAPRLILTANHCVDDLDINGRVQYSMLADFAEFPEKEYILPHPAHIIALDGPHDLALIHADLVMAPHDVAKVGMEEIEIGAPVFAFGNPRGMIWSFSSGEVAAIRYMPDDDEHKPMWYVQATVPISPGSSGGGLFDEWGRLIGITRMYIRGSENLNFFVHRDYIAHFVKEWAN